MPNPTTYFGWVMPLSSDLVTGLPTQFATFGNAVDTSMSQLLGGTAGQVLSKTSSTNMAFTWINNDVGDITEVAAGTGITVTSGTGPIPTVTNSMQTTINAAGDILYGTANDAVARLAIGSTNQALGVTAGIPAWQASSKSTLTTTGDLLYASAANTPARLAIGSVSQVLTVAGGIPTWATAASTTGVLGAKTITNGSNYSTTSSTLTAVSTANARLTVSAPASGILVVILSGIPARGTGSTIWSASVGAGTVYEMVVLDDSYDATSSSVKTAVAIITGLTSTTSYNVDWMFRSTTAGQTSQVIGDQATKYPRMVVLG